MARKFQRAPGAGNQLQQQDVQALIGLLQQGRHKQVEIGTRKLIKKFPAALILLDILSKALMAQEKFQETARVLEKLVAQKPDHIDGHYNLGLLYMNLDMTQKAVDRFRYVIEKSGGSADAYTNLGAALFELEQYGEAADFYRKAVELKPDYVPALRNLGAALRMVNRLEESEEYLSKIPALMPQLAAGHLSLGVTRRMLGKTREALESFETALDLEPDNREAINELGNIHFADGRYEEAVDCFRKVGTTTSRAMVLEAMHQASTYTDTLLDALSELNLSEPKNLRGAAFSAFASHQYNIDDTHGFAPDPLKYVSIRPMAEFLAANPNFLARLMEEAEHLASTWENHTTLGGFQSYGNLFDASGSFETLETMIRSELARYRDEKSELGGGIIQGFPSRYELDGWHVKLLKSGHQKPHIHSRGWVSGVFYLKVPDNIPGNEGAISFSLHGYNYRKLREDIPELIHKPSAGELVLFPSSLFHSTVPFESEDDHQCIAFDVIPV